MTESRISKLQELMEKLAGFDHGDNTDRFLLSAEISRYFDWDKWQVEIPYLNFPSHWRVKITPPRMGAVVRFRVHTDAMPEEKDVSVYLDCYDLLGWFGSPYWEVFPVEGETFRCAMQETKELLDGIERGIRSIMGESERNKNGGAKS